MDNCDKLEELPQYLCEKETINGKAFIAILNGYVEHEETLGDENPCVIM